MSALHGEIVNEMVTALRNELHSSLPKLLASVLEELNESRLTAPSFGSLTEAEKIADTVVASSELPVVQSRIEVDDEHLKMPTVISTWQATTSLDSTAYVALANEVFDDQVASATTKNMDLAQRLTSRRSSLSEVADPQAVMRLRQEIADLQEQMNSASEKLSDFDAHCNHRRQVFEDDVDSLNKRLRDKQDLLELAMSPKSAEMPAPPGPVFFRFVESEWFGLVCNLVILLNLISMAVQSQFDCDTLFENLNIGFLIWYVFELAAKAFYYQQHLLCGSFSVVLWNYLDLCVVVGGLLDQFEAHTQHLAALRAFRFFRLFRLFRLLRFLKILKVFLNEDLAWVDGPVFQVIMFSVILINAVLMGVELDVKWVGWLFVENVFLGMYAFELAVQLKRQKCEYFLDMGNAFFNYLDVVMVFSGALNQWLLPLLMVVANLLNGKAQVLPSRDWGHLMRILRILRILRVLRLVRLVKMVKPLYRVLVGVRQSVRAMQWVLVLTLITLYACAIVFTSLIGHGLLSNEHVTEDVDRYFGSMPRSMFSLFRLMNGDVSVVHPITDLIAGRLLFIGFTVISNWAILAILTSVVSDNIISSSARLQEEDEAKEREKDHAMRLRRLVTLFKEIDHTGSGYIGKRQWYAMLADRTLHHEIKDASGFSEEELRDCFDCLALADVDGTHGLKLPYNTFLKILEVQGTAPDKGSIMHVVLQLRALESRLFAKLSDSRGKENRTLAKRSESRGSKIQL